jgi:hypothetical protein
MAEAADRTGHRNPATGVADIAQRPRGNRSPLFGLKLSKQEE